MRVRRNDPDNLGIHRRRRGRGFSYHDAAGDRIDDAEVLTRIRSLVIPPVWRGVQVAIDPHGQIQARGTDEAGCRQYIYHPAWACAREREKFTRVRDRPADIADRGAVPAGWARSHTSPSRVQCSAAAEPRRVPRRGEEYLRENDTHGLSALLRSQVTLRPDGLSFRYVGKSGARQDRRVYCPEVVPVVRSMRQAPQKARRFLVHRDRTGWHDLHAQEVNAELKALADDFSAKDLRTWNATAYAAYAYAVASHPDTPTRRRHAEVMRAVAKKLGNTPAVARASYVGPALIDAHEKGKVLDWDGAQDWQALYADDAMRGALDQAVLGLLGPRDSALGDRVLDAPSRRNVG